MARRKRRSPVAAVTVLSWSRKDLLRFSESVEQIRHLAQDLRTIVAELSRVPARKRKPPSAASPNGDEPCLMNTLKTSTVGEKA